MAGEVDERAWRELSAQVEQELAAWRRAHPRATLAEIEASVDGALRRLPARYRRDLVVASPSADLAATPPAERPRCPQCGGALAARGRQPRALLTPGPPEPVAFTRSYAVCSACGAGLFPPG
ncbi:MAG TPA: hypothetical protein VFW96_20720 [Thermomicrobiales bacterium]|nr:hypothetical protein [Thermomicrobiales bacterium]